MVVQDNKQVGPQDKFNRSTKQIHLPNTKYQTKVNYVHKNHDDPGILFKVFLRVTLLKLKVLCLQRCVSVQFLTVLDVTQPPFAGNRFCILLARLTIQYWKRFSLEPL